MPSAEIIDDAGRLSALSEAWDRLAEQAAAPYGSPLWLLPWWRHVAPPGATLQVTAVRDEGGELVGLGPWYRARGRGAWLRPLGAGVCDRVGPLSAPGHEAVVAEELMHAVARLSPRSQVISLEGLQSASPWPAALRSTGMVHVTRWRTEPALALNLDGRGFGEWWMAKSKHFRQRMRRLRRDFEESGGTFRLADPETLDHDLAAFTALHRARWEGRGGSTALLPGTDAMLLDAGRALVGSGRMRIWSLDLNGATVSSHLLLRAGDEIGYWLTGFDEQRGPGTSTLGILNAIEDAFSTDARRLDLGRGRMAYKQRFTQEGETLTWDWVVPKGPGGWAGRARLAPKRARLVASERLPESVKARLRPLANR